MNYNPLKHHRKSIRIPGYDYASEGWYFITICVQDKQCIFGNVYQNRMILNNIGKIVDIEWKKTTKIRQNIDLDEYIIMPNHIHGIIHIKNHPVGAARWVDLDYYKKNKSIDPIDIKNDNKNRAIDPIAPTENSCNKLKSNSLGSIIGQYKSVVTKKIRKMGYIHFKWQRNYWEHIIRDENDLNRIRKYIIENPLNWSYDKH